ncbi:mitochondrial protein C2orf69 isoform X2 [Anthonomus grandis grandis]|uniref:mitochondrial protein C2orf69 isoform X2 n=1 Tax=Anthonomus grandis grandis TaxID=2921223 RepID=UPI0021661851|nr:mitochondrial protein C2orf69 isoform X2 [Anthonomus grandis grandis]
MSRKILKFEYFYCNFLTFIRKPYCFIPARLHLEYLVSRMSSNVTSCERLLQLSGFEERKNDVVYAPPKNITQPSRVVVFFPGDVQDYIENMESHRDNKHHKQWNLEDTALKLQKKFPDEHILVVKPARMDFKTFSCFQNFVNSSDMGVPSHCSDHNGLRHLSCLLESVSKVSKTNLSLLDITLIGFSKGCVVLNQFLHEFHQFASVKNEEMLSFIRKIRDMYWLDGGHSGGKHTWVNDKEILRTVVSNKYPCSRNTLSNRRRSTALD